MKKYLVTTHEECIVRYTYVIYANNEFDAVRKLVLQEDAPMRDDDYEIISDIKTLSIENVKELA